MTEEEVTKSILKWLIEKGWKIICYDFPQSGTGKFIHQNNVLSKNKNSINPDIVAVKREVCLFFENKDRYYYPDFQKINLLITTDNYSDGITRLLTGQNIRNIYYGIGLPCSAYTTLAEKNQGLVDFIVGVKEDKSISKIYVNSNISFG